VKSGTSSFILGLPATYPRDNYVVNSNFKSGILCGGRSSHARSLPEYLIRQCPSVLKIDPVDLWVEGGLEVQYLIKVACRIRMERYAE